jgi:hypothetical protein
MKLGCIAGLLLAAGCAAPPARPAAPPPVEPASDLVDRLRIERDYHPAPTGGERVAVFYELPRSAWVAQGWAWWRPWGAWCRRPFRPWRCG